MEIYNKKGVMRMPPEITAGLVLIFLDLILIVFFLSLRKRNKRQARVAAEILKRAPGGAGAADMPEETLDRLLKKDRRKRTAWIFVGAVAALAYLAYIVMSVLSRQGAG